jgi:hypothetical protein
MTKPVIRPANMGDYAAQVTLSELIARTHYEALPDLVKAAPVPFHTQLPRHGLWRLD